MIIFRVKLKNLLLFLLFLPLFSFADMGWKKITRGELIDLLIDNPISYDVKPGSVFTKKTIRRLPLTDCLGIIERKYTILLFTGGKDYILREIKSYWDPKIPRPEECVSQPGPFEPGYSRDIFLKDENYYDYTDDLTTNSLSWYKNYKGIKKIYYNASNSLVKIHYTSQFGQNFESIINLKGNGYNYIKKENWHLFAQKEIFDTTTVIEGPNVKDLEALYKSLQDENIYFNYKYPTDSSYCCGEDLKLPNQEPYKPRFIPGETFGSILTKWRESQAKVQAQGQSQVKGRN